MSSEKHADFTQLLGPKVLTKPNTTGVPTASALAGKKLVALYFSASWCPPCKAFSPKLAEFYNTCSDTLEVIYISSDKDDDAFNGYFKTMPWLAAIPAYKNAETNKLHSNLAAKFKIQGIPTLIILDAKTGYFITDDGRTDVMEASTDEAKKELVESWKAKEAVPIEQAVFGAGGPSGLMSVVQFFAKNPLYIVGGWYLFKRLMRYLEALGSEDDDEGTAEL